MLQGYPEILSGLPLSPYLTRYLPPFDEFEVDRCVLPKGSSVVFPAVPGPSIFLTFVGEGTMKTGCWEGIVTGGDVVFGPANTELVITATATELQLYRAGINSRFFHGLWIYEHCRRLLPLSFCSLSEKNKLLILFIYAFFCCHFWLCNFRTCIYIL